MNVVVLTEGSNKVGFGHLTRCVALAQALQERGAQIVFYVNGTDIVAPLLEGMEWELCDWHKDSLLVFDDVDVVIVDSYEASVETCFHVAELVSQIVFFDDNNRIRYPKGLVINGAVNAADLPYVENPGVTYLLGADFIALRRVFWDIKRQPLAKIRRAYVTVGGYDVLGILPRILKALTRWLPAVEKHVVAGNSNVLCKQRATNLIYVHNNCSAQEIQQLMCTADFAVSAGGQTLCELARCGVPTAGICVEENQRNNFNAWVDAQCIVPFEEKYLETQLSAFCMACENVAWRESFFVRGQTLVDGQGARRIVAAIEERVVS